MISYWHINDKYCLNMRKAYISEEDLKTYMKNYYKQEHVKKKGIYIINIIIMKIEN